MLTLFDTRPLHLDMCSAGYRILSHYWPAWLPLFYFGNRHTRCPVLLLPLHALSHSDADQNLDLAPHWHNKHLHVHKGLWFNHDETKMQIYNNIISVYTLDANCEYICILHIWIKRNISLAKKKIITSNDSFKCHIERGKLSFLKF